MYKSAAEFFRAANGREVIKRVEGAACVEDWPAMLESYRAQLDKQGAVEGKDYRVNDDGIVCGMQFIMKPKRQRESRGIMTVRSADYAVPNESGNLVWGEKKGATVEGGRLIKQYDGWRVTFEIAA